MLHAELCCIPTEAREELQAALVQVPAPFLAAGGGGGIDAAATTRLASLDNVAAGLENLVSLMKDKMSARLAANRDQLAPRPQDGSILQDGE